LSTLLIKNIFSVCDACDISFGLFSLWLWCGQEGAWERTGGALSLKEWRHVGFV
jgi:hypothetical protein